MCLNFYSPRRKVRRAIRTKDEDGLGKRFCFFCGETEEEKKKPSVLAIKETIRLTHKFREAKHFNQPNNSFFYRFLKSVSMSASAVFCNNCLLWHVINIANCKQRFRHGFPPLHSTPPVLSDTLLPRDLPQHPTKRLSDNLIGGVSFDRRCIRSQGCVAMEMWLPCED